MRLRLWRRARRTSLACSEGGEGGGSIGPHWTALDWTGRDGTVTLAWRAS